jgi:predicted RNase H-like nuclease (RuvC/YqgF family)
MPILTDQEDLAIQAKLNFILGAKTYDTYLQGFRCAELSGGVVIAYARSEYMAGVISAKYSTQIAVAVESIVRQPAAMVLVLPCRKQPR